MKLELAAQKITREKKKILARKKLSNAYLRAKGIHNNLSLNSSSLSNRRVRLAADSRVHLKDFDELASKFEPRPNFPNARKSKAWEESSILNIMEYRSKKAKQLKALRRKRDLANVIRKDAVTKLKQATRTRHTK
ncbi:MAG: hypothetical protein PHQ98_04305 [Candidatus ainarchaeum sp.]|nr:hypothetical protein [Candidatus ainarchaeum sp.]